MTDIVPIMPLAPMDHDAWRGPKRFRSRKVQGEVLAATRLHEDFLILASLDPQVATIAAPFDPIPMPEPFGSHLPAIELRMTDGSVRLVDVLSNDAADDRVGVAHRAMVGEAAKAADKDWTVATEDEIVVTPKLTNARLAYGARNVRVPAGDRIRFLQFLEESGGATLIEAARLASANVEGVEAILSLVMENMIEFDMDGPLVPETTVRRTTASYQSASVGRAA